MNYAQMTAQWNPPTPIEDLFLQLREGQLFATEESEMIDGIQLLRHEQDDSYTTDTKSQTGLPSRQTAQFPIRKTTSWLTSLKQ